MAGAQEQLDLFRENKAQLACKLNFIDSPVSLLYHCVIAGALLRAEFRVLEGHVS